jgi:hypothetical protein
VVLIRLGGNEDPHLMGVANLARTVVFALGGFAATEKDQVFLRDSIRPLTSAYVVDRRFGGAEKRPCWSLALPSDKAAKADRTAHY